MAGTIKDMNLINQVLKVTTNLLRRNLLEIYYKTLKTN